MTMKGLRRRSAANEEVGEVHARLIIWLRGCLHRRFPGLRIRNHPRTHAQQSFTMICSPGFSPSFTTRSPSIMDRVSPGDFDLLLRVTA